MAMCAVIFFGTELVTVRSVLGRLERVVLVVMVRGRGQNTGGCHGDTVLSSSPCRHAPLLHDELPAAAADAVPWLRAHGPGQNHNTVQDYLVLPVEPDLV